MLVPKSSDAYIISPNQKGLNILSTEIIVFGNNFDA